MFLEKITTFYCSIKKFFFVSVRKSEKNFIIPELPYGRSLIINILNTWGDKNYVGLNGIEIFSEFGKPIIIEKVLLLVSYLNIKKNI